MSFQYVSANSELEERVYSLLSRMESVALLGPRYIGKRDVCQRIAAKLREIESNPVLTLDVLEHVPVHDAAVLNDLLMQAVDEEARRLNSGVQIRLESQSFECAPAPRSSNSDCDLAFDAIDSMFNTFRDAVVLIVTNVDALSYNLAHEFLRSVRSRAQDGKIVTLITGEYDLRDLVWGPNSEFTVPYQFVLQGLAYDQFSALLEQHGKSLGVEFEDWDSACTTIYQTTGGDPILTRLIVWTTAKVWSRQAAGKTEPIPTENIPTTLSRLRIPPSHMADIIRNAAMIISHKPTCWESLKRLIRGERVELEPGELAPTTLELAGVARRDTVAHSLTASSPLMTEFLVRYYTPRRFGDLLAGIGNWDLAFSVYEDLSPIDRIRPTGIDDCSEVALIVDSLTSAMYERAAENVEDVTALFTRGCTLVLGMPDVVFWQYDCKWQQSDSKTYSEEALKIMRLLLPVTGTPIGVMNLPSQHARNVIAAVLPTVRQNQIRLVYIGDFSGHELVANERIDLLMKLTRHYCHAMQHATEIARQRLRLKIREQDVATFTSIFQAIGTEVRDSHQALKIAAIGLQAIGYSSVRFYLIGSDRNMLRCVVDQANSHSSPSHRKSWHLGDGQSLLAATIADRLPRIVPDFGDEPLDHDTAIGDGLISGAIAPILSQRQPIGAIYVERSDGLVPTTDEMDDLMNFASQLAVAIEQSERVNLLQSALDYIADPIVVLDTELRVRYANEPASSHFNIETGWRRGGEAPNPANLPRMVCDWTAVSLQTGKRMENYIDPVSMTDLAIMTDISANLAPVGEYVTNCVFGPDGSPLGVVLNVRDMANFNRILKALRTVATAKDLGAAIRSMLSATSTLNHSWGRLYLVDQNQPTNLVIEDSYGTTTQSPSRVSTFDKPSLSPADLPSEAWACLDEAKPLIFTWDPTRPQGACLMTETQLEVRNIQTKQWPDFLGKCEGDFWIDFPLLAGSQRLGKLTLQCESDVSRDRFRLLAVLAQMGSGLLHAFLERENAARNVASKALFEIGHHFMNDLALLREPLATYKKFASVCPGLEPINNQVTKYLDRATEVSKRAIDLLEVGKLRRSKFNIRDLVLSTMELEFTGESRVTGIADISIMADDIYLGMLLSELIRNSKKHSGRGTDLVIAIDLSIIGALPSQWLKIEVSDNGRGVPQLIKDKIFEYSYTTRADSGLGIGLGFAQRICVAHNGSVRESGLEGEGAKFDIFIPLLEC